jgi:hypothetical protein
MCILFLCASDVHRKRRLPVFAANIKRIISGTVFLNNGILFFNPKGYSACFLDEFPNRGNSPYLHTANLGM